MTPSLTAPEHVQTRLDAGQRFNAYETARGDTYLISIGPISNLLHLAQCHDAEVADMVVDALRAAFGQQPALATLAQALGDDNG